MGYEVMKDKNCNHRADRDTLAQKFQHRNSSYIYFQRVTYSQ